MTQEEQKELLLRDLSARLLYGVKCKLIYNNKAIKDEDATLFAVDKYGHFLFAEFGEDTREFVCKPYLLPLSSMTEEQRIELYKVLGWGYESHYHLLKEWEDFNESIDNNDLFLPASWISNLNKMYNWLNENHFDYRGLIPMGLAINATGLNIY